METTTLQKTKTKVSLLLMVGFISAVFAALFVINFLEAKREANNISFAAINTSNIDNSNRLPQGSIVHLIANNNQTDNVEFNTFDGGYIRIKLLRIEEFDRARVDYAKYDKNGKLEVERGLAFGPQDMGWEIEVFKVGIDRATLTVPLRPGQPF